MNFRKVKSQPPGWWITSNGIRFRDYAKAQWHQIEYDSTQFFEKSFGYFGYSFFLRIKRSQKFRKDLREILDIWDQKNK